MGRAEAQEQNGSVSQPAEHVAQSVVQLLAIGPGQGDKNRACSATGFFVNEEGYILTNAHVVEDARRCLAGSPEAKIVAKLPRPDARAATAVSCEVVALDEEHDLALLKTERPPPEGENYPVAFLEEREVRAGAEVRVLGHPQFSWRPKRRDTRNASRSVAVSIRHAIDLLNRYEVRWSATPE
jgi:S1-C subfamily serine protease